MGAGREGIATGADLRGSRRDEYVVSERHLRVSLAIAVNVRVREMRTPTFSALYVLRRSSLAAFKSLRVGLLAGLTITSALPLVE